MHRNRLKNTDNSLEARDMLAANLVDNAGLESGNLSSWGGFGTREIVADAANGSNAVKVTGTAGHNQLINGLQANTEYTLSANAKVQNGSSALLGVKNYGGPETAQKVNSTSYSPSSLTFTTGANNSSANVYLFVPQAGNVAFGDDFSVTANAAQSGPTNSSPSPQQPSNPAPGPNDTSAPASNDYQRFQSRTNIGNVKQGDIVNLHYDFAPDTDDGLASGLGSILADQANINPFVVAGTVGPGNQTDVNQQFDVNAFGDDGYRVSANGVNTKDLLNRTFGSQNWVQAAQLTRLDNNGNKVGQPFEIDTIDPDRDIAELKPGVINRTASLWSEALANGKSVHVADGGTSDFTHDVLRKMISDGTSANQIKNRVNVYQHSKVNRGWTSRAKYDWLQNNSNYINLPDGNKSSPASNTFNGFRDLPDPIGNDFNGTGGLNGFNQSKYGFISDSFKYADKPDGSDVVELVYLLGQENNLKRTSDIAALSQGSKSLT